MKAKAKTSKPVRSGKRKDKKKKSDLPIVMSTDGAVQVHCRFDKLEDPNTLKIHSANPARHPKEQVELLAKIIASHGIRHPIIVSALSGNIVAGHCRRESAILLGLKEYPVVVQAFKDSAQELAVLIADNRIQELAEIDGQTMADVLVELDQVNYPLELTALTEVEIHDYVLGPTEPTPQDDVVPDPPKKPKTIMGDMYLLGGDHRILCGNSTKAEDVERVMGGEKADMVFTDPPYGVGYEGGASNKRKRSQMIGDETTDLYGPCCSMAYRYSAADAPLYLWHAGTKGNAAAAAAAGYEIRCELIWHKLKAHYGAFTAQYMQKHEPCYYCFKKGHSSRWNGPANEVTVWEIEQAAKNEYHPTQKPVALALRAIGNHHADLILDPFLGSGTTIIAAEKLGRKCYGLEIDPLYTQVCIERWEKFTGKSAILESTGQTFAEVKRVRAK